MQKPELVRRGPERTSSAPSYRSKSPASFSQFLPSRHPGPPWSLAHAGAPADLVPPGLAPEPRLWAAFSDHQGRSSRRETRRKGMNKLILCKRKKKMQLKTNRTHSVAFPSPVSPLPSTAPQPLPDIPQPNPLLFLLKSREHSEATFFFPAGSFRSMTSQGSNSGSYRPRLHRSVLM